MTKLIQKAFVKLKFGDMERNLALDLQLKPLQNTKINNPNSFESPYDFINEIIDNKNLCLKHLKTKDLG